MIEFRTLGTVDLRGAGGDHPLLQPKRIALLTCVAIQAQTCFVRRDSLLPLFWPESDQEHARGALRNALHHLRRSIGAGVLVTRGDEEIGLDWSAFWCDAVAFEQLVRDGRAAEALALYHGDFLEGFHVSDAPEFERWLDAQRARLRAHAAAAAARCADEAERAGDAAAAARWAEHAFLLSGDDEAAFRRLLRLLHEAGDRARAIRLYEEFARRMAEEYGIEPAPETAALAAALHASPERSLNAPPETAPASVPAARVRAATRGSSAPAAGPTSGRAAVPAVTPEPAARPGEATRRRSRIGPGVLFSRGLAALVAAAVVATAAYAISGRHRPADAPLSPNTVAVLPFAFQGTDELRYLGEGMVQLLSTELNGAGELRAVDPRAVLSLEARVRREGGEIERARALARRLGAGLFVLGDVVAVGNRLAITARLYRTDRERAVAQAAMHGEAENVFEMTDELTQELLAGRSTGPGDRLTRVAALTTHSLPAFKAFLEGEQAFRVGDASAPVEALQRATTLDTGFAVGYYRLSVAAEWAGRPELVASAMARAIRHRERLSRSEWRLLEAARAWRGGHAEEAEALYNAILADDPSNVEAWFQLGEILFHQAPIWGDSVEAARGAFQHALALDPDLLEARGHLALIAAKQGRWSEFDTLARAIEAANPDSRLALEVRAIRAFAGHDSAAQARVLANLAVSGEGTVRVVAGLVFQATQDLDATARITRLLIEPWQPAETRALGHIWLARLAIARRRWDIVDAELRAAADLDPVQALEARALLSTLPFIELPRRALLAVREALVRWDAEAVPPSVLRAPVYSSVDGAHASIRRYLLGLISARLGEHAAALRYADQLRTHSTDAEDRLRDYTLARGVVAEVARLQGRLADALATLDTDPPPIWYQRMSVSPFLSQARERFVRADLLERLGRPGEALRWYRTLAPGPTYLIPYFAETNRRIARIRGYLQADGNLGRDRVRRPGARSCPVRACG